MRAIILAAAIAGALIGPALAKPGEPMRHNRYEHHAMSAHRVMNARAEFAAPDPYGVYIDGQEIGRDPDANIRSSLRSEYYENQGN
ncbi:hypothetical protein [Bradyrhizobium sp. LHD-71]|uniref:hypothetical protein n=1 Tax=Bradyrhizobium sp. LHD-71 TaxID=3072141 RepID=UPI00280E2B82|nr:hypothetical protein [Bradyrhizobium sp. LHD-71]MDQ8728541.1 hypothetical protein [Bradyrhizobium sp. LHD-71]